MNEVGGSGENLVWVSRFRSEGRERVSAAECPVSLVTAESWALVEEFFVWRRLGGRFDVWSAPARRVDAYGVLERELRSLEREDHAERAQ